MTPLLAALPWALALGLVTLLLWWLYRQPPQVFLTRELPRAGYSGREVPLTVRLHLRSALPLRYVVEDAPPGSVVPRAGVVFAGEVLGERESVHQTTLMLNRRGEFEWPQTVVRWADPLGLFWRVHHIHVPAHLDVFPGTHGLQLPHLLRPLLSEGGWTPTLGLDDPLSLRGAREYVRGDSPGRIHWRLSARRGGLGGNDLMVRELEKMAASSLVVYLDTSGGPGLSGQGQEVYLESAVRLASSLVQEALALQLPVSVATPGQQTPTGRGPEAAQAALLALARVRAQPGPPQIMLPRSGSNLVILTARGGPELVQQAMRARATASRVSIVALPEGFYLEPGEKPRRQWAAAPDSVRELERQAGVLAEAGILVFVLRGNQSVLQLGG